MKNWSKTSYRNKTALQQPDWPDREQYEKVVRSLSALPPLVFAGEIRDLKARLAQIGRAHV